MRSYFRLATPLAHARRLPSVAVFTFLVAAAFASLSPAQPQYRSDEIDANARKGGETAVKNSLKDPATYATDKQKVEDYFVKWYFPLMTRSGPLDFEKLGKLRLDLINNVLRAATANEQLQKEVTQAALKYMQSVVVLKDPPYHPAVRYNAVLVIGMLDQQYAIEAAGGRPPQPLLAANTFLVKLLDVANQNNPNVIPALVVGALVGLQRHAQFHQSLPPESIAAMTAIALKIATREEPLPEADRETMAWIRLKAAEVLAQLGSPGQDGAVHGALLKLIAESKSLDDRCAIASQLTKIKYDGAKVDGKATAETIFKWAHDVGEAERTRAKEFEEHRIGGAVSTPTSSTRPAGLDPYGMPEPFARRPLLAHVAALRTVLTKLKPILSTDDQTRVDAMLKAIGPVIEGAGAKDTTDLEVTDRVKAMADAIDRATPQDADASKDEFEAPAAAPAARDVKPATTEAPPAAPVATPEAGPPPAAAAEATSAALTN